MKKNTIIPNKIKIGFQERDDTYTKKLAYVIYYDNKGVLRKEKSWQSWRDKKIEPEEFENVPMSGFVLNKKVGGYKSDWNYRQSYIRVYDPRGFEFEITLENLLFILENVECLMGKGLNGEFVYGWDKTDLVLLPTNCQEYGQLKNFNDSFNDGIVIKEKNLKIGNVYLTKKNDKVLYMGKHKEIDENLNISKNEKLFFYDLDKEKFSNFNYSSSREYIFVEENYSEHSSIYNLMRTNVNSNFYEENCVFFEPYSFDELKNIIFNHEDYRHFGFYIEDLSCELKYKYIYGYKYYDHSCVIYFNNYSKKFDINDEKNLLDFYNEFKPCKLIKK